MPRRRQERETGAEFTCSAKFDAGGSAKVAVTETRAPNEFSKVETGTTVTCPVTGAGGGVGNVSFEFSDAVGAIDETSVDTGS